MGETLLPTLEERATENKKWMTEWRKAIVDPKNKATIDNAMSQHPMVRWFMGKIDEQTLEQYISLLRDFHQVFTTNGNEPRVGASIRFATYYDVWLYLPDETKQLYPDVIEIMTYWENHPATSCNTPMMVAKQHGPIMLPYDLEQVWQKQIPMWYEGIFGKKEEVNE